MTWQEWNEIAINFEGKKAKIFCNDGICYEGIGDTYFYDENSKGENVVVISLKVKNGLHTSFFQEEVEKIEFLE